MFRRVAIAIAAMVTAACAGSRFEPPPDPPGPSLIRLHNASRYPMEQLRARFFSEMVDYGRLEPGQMSPYQSVERAYRYAYLEAIVNGERRSLHPIDFLGERLLGRGRFTYRLSFDSESGRLAIETDRDP